MPDSTDSTRPDRPATSGARPHGGRRPSADEVVQKALHPLPEPLRGAVITVSDRCASGAREDTAGPLAVRLLAGHDVVVDQVRVVPDGAEPVRAAIRAAVADGARVVLTTGGTGVTPRDLTPEGTAPLLAARLEGLEAQVRAHGLTKGWWGSPTAVRTAPSWSTRRDRAAGSRTPWPSSARSCRTSWSSSGAATTEGPSGAPP